MLQDKILSIDNVAGGLVTMGSPLVTKDQPITQTPDCLNVYGIWTTIRKRLGFAKVNSSTYTNAGNGIYNYKYDNTTQYLVSLIATALKKMDVVTSAWDGGWDSITVDANLGTTLSNDRAHFTNWEGICIISTDSQDVPQRYFPGSGAVAKSANQRDLDWEDSHAVVTGDIATYTATSGDKLKITIDGSYIFDDIIMTGDASIANAVASINAHSGFSARGLAYADDNGYLAVVSNVRGTGSVVLVEDGGTGNGGEAEDLFDASSAVTSTGVAGAPSAKFYIVWKDHTWAGNVSSYPDRLQRSANGSYTDWAGTDSGSKDISTEDDVGITGFAILQGKLYVFKKRSIWRVSYLGGTPLLEYRQATSLGTSSPRTIRLVDVPGEGSRIFFLGTDRQVYKFDGYNVVPISEPVREYNTFTNYCMIGDDTTYGINSTALNACHATLDTENHHYKLYFCLGNDTTPKDSFVYDYLIKTWWPMNYSTAFKSSCNADNGAGRIREYVQGTGFAYLMNSGNADVAAAITAHWTTRKLGEAPTLAKLNSINILSKSVACTPTLHYRANWNSSWVAPTDSATLATATNDHNKGLPIIPNLIQFRLRDSSTDAAFEFFAIHLIGEKIGRGK